MAVAGLAPVFPNLVAPKDLGYATEAAHSQSNLRRFTRISDNKVLIGLSEVKAGDQLICDEMPGQVIKVFTDPKPHRWSDGVLAVEAEFSKLT
jgi:hypothetical protein